MDNITYLFPKLESTQVVTARFAWLNELERVFEEAIETAYVELQAPGTALSPIESQRVIEELDEAAAHLEAFIEQYRHARRIALMFVTEASPP